MKERSIIKLMKIKIVKKIEVVGYEVVRKVEVFEREVSEFSFKELMKVCGCKSDDGMGWEDWGYGDGVKVIGNVDGDVEFICVKI